MWTKHTNKLNETLFPCSPEGFRQNPGHKPHPPLWVGGRSEAALRRAVAVGAAWAPTSRPLPMLQEKMAQLRHLAHESGRAKGPGVTVHQSVQLATGHTPATGEARRLGQGTPHPIRADLYHSHD